MGKEDFLKSKEHFLEIFLKVKLCVIYKLPEENSFQESFLEKQKAVSGNSKTSFKKF